MQVDFIVKLGGSAITRKAELETLNKEAVSAAAAVLKQCFDRRLRFVIVHGAGSFGHHHAHQYKINQGYADLQEEAEQAKVKQGYCKCRLSVCKLNHIVVTELEIQGLPVVGLSPCGSWVTDNGAVIESGCDIIQRHLEAGFVPVLHGDCVLDKSQGCRILSGDKIIKVMCQRFNPSRVIYMMDVPGVYDISPHLPGAALVPVLEVAVDRSLSLVLETSAAAHPDVTGGIRSKLDSILDIVLDSEGSIPVFLCSLSGSEAFLLCCSAGTLVDSPGTVVRLKQSRS